MAKVTFEYVVASLAMSLEEGDFILIREGKVYGFLPKETFIPPAEETPSSKKEETPSAKATRAPRGTGNRMQEAVLAALESGPATSRELRERMFLASEHRGLLNNAIYSLKGAGFITAQGNARPALYALV